MANVTISRAARAPLPPIESVTLKMSVDEAIQLSALVGCFGGEYYVGEMFYNLTDNLEIDFCVNDGDEMNDATDTYRRYVRKADAAIAFRAEFTGRTKPDA